MKKIIITICTIIGLLEIGVIVAYFCVFNNGISTDNQDWGTFIQIFEGFIMAILTAVNIYIFYQLTVAIEDKNQERVVKQKVSDAQRIITQMRLSEYDRIKKQINEIIQDIHCKQIDKNKVFGIIKELEYVSASLLFKNGKLSEKYVLEDITNKILSYVVDIETLINNPQIQEETITTLKTYIIIMELYVIGQLVSDREVENYIKRNIGTSDIDCTISCITEIFDTKNKQDYL